MTAGTELSVALGKGHRFVDISGQRFGRLLAVTRSGTEKNGKVVWDCLCDCGSSIQAIGSSLRTGNTRSCGCAGREKLIAMSTKHGNAKSTGESRAYMIWSQMISRCHTTTHKDYRFYGARGISVCELWRHSFKSFLSDMGDPPVGMTIERKENWDGYSQRNCVWATRTEQANNMRSNVMVRTQNALMTMAQFSKTMRLPYANIRSKINRGVRSIHGVNIEVFKRGQLV